VRAELSPGAKARLSFVHAPLAAIGGRVSPDRGGIFGGGMSQKNITLVIDGIPEAGPYLGNGVVPLDALSAPLVSEMQAVIRRQNEVLQQCYHAMDYLLSRNNQNYERLRYVLDATEADARLTAAIAALTGEPRKVVCGAYGCFYAGDK
jgi:hypothetical protein